jgi:hypothetical protein
VNEIMTATIEVGFVLMLFMTSFVLHFALGDPNSKA